MESMMSNHKVEINIKVIQYFSFPYSRDCLSALVLFPKCLLLIERLLIASEEIIHSVLSNVDNSAKGFPGIRSLT